MGILDILECRPQYEIATVARREKSGLSNEYRVERVEIYKRGDNDKLFERYFSREELDRETVEMYDLEVEGHPSYYVADMSSDILSRPIDVSQYDIIYGGAQKNLAPAGVTFVIIKDWVGLKFAANIQSFLRKIRIFFCSSCTSNSGSSSRMRSDFAISIIALSKFRRYL